LVLFAAGAVTWLAYRATRRLAQTAGGVVSQELESEIYMARVGYITNCLFFFLIVMETVPIFFFLRTC
jgi:hypothetical protein